MQAASPDDTVVGQPSSAAGAAACDADAERPRYLVIERIGGGRLGALHRAYDVRLQREVALRSFETSELSPDASARLLANAQAMAKLSHPNIIPVYDARADGGRLVLAMEYVHGTTLERWLEHVDARPRSWRQTLEAFIAAGRGLAAAHAIGLVHGGFEAASVLVGSDGRVRVTDFGVMQAWAASRDVGQQLDLHAYCLAVHAALTGEGGTPARGEALARRLRSNVPRGVAAALRRGLDPDPSKRWRTLDALLDALSRDLARGWSPWIACASVLLVLCTSGAVWAGWQRARAQRCSGALAQIEDVWHVQRQADVERSMLATGLPYARDVSRNVGAQIDAYVTAWVEGHREACEATTVRGEQPPEVLDLRMACLHRAKVQLAAVAELFAHADTGTVAKAHQVTSELPPLEHCSDIDALRDGVAPPPEGEREAIEAARSRLAEVKVLRDAGKYEQARRVLDEVSAQTEHIGYRPLHTELSLYSGIIDQHLGELLDARAALRLALTEGLRSGQRTEALSAAAHLLAVVGHAQGRAEEAEPYIPVAVGLCRKGGAEEADLRKGLALLYEAKGSFEDAEREYRAALELLAPAGEGSVKALVARMNLASLLQTMERLEEAQAEHRATLETATRLLGREHPHTITIRYNLGLTLEQLGHHDEAEAFLRESLAQFEQVLGAEHPFCGYAMNSLGSLLSARGRHAEAEAVLRRGVAFWERLPVQPERAKAHFLMARVLLAAGRLEQAEAASRRALELHFEMFPPQHYLVAWNRQYLAKVLSARGRHRDAHEQVRIALAAWETAAGSDGADTARCRADLGRVLEALGRHDEARSELEAAHRVLEDRLGAEDPEVIALRARLEAEARSVSATP